SPLAHPLDAQRAYYAPGQRVEVFGLRHWTPAALQDSISRKVPGQALHDAACMATLTQTFGFADAEVTRLTMVGGPGAKSPTDRRHYLLIKLVEPQDSAEVVWAPEPRGMSVLRPEYASLVQPSLGETHATAFGWTWFLPALQYYGLDSAGRAQGLKQYPQLQKDASRLWAFLDAQSSPASRDLALIALRDDALYVNRLVAAMILVNFADEDAAWLALVEAMRDSHPAVRALATHALGTMKPRTVDWTPAVPTLRLLIGGTNVRAFEDVVQMLVQTGIAPAHGRALLSGNSRWVLEHLRAENPMTLERTTRFLKRMNGGRDASASKGGWEAWLARL
ncbi:MAG TPA: HEAT repeat domain-containing protein, partial [Longimicrobiales bacterium]|nr:HEAT repeat domain-containing protein [Longimicrobiales bacterium]